MRHRRPVRSRDGGDAPHRTMPTLFHPLTLHARRLDKKLAADTALPANLVTSVAYVCHAQLLHGPSTAKRKAPVGVSAVGITSTGHIAVHTLVDERELILDVLSSSPVESRAIEEALLKLYPTSNVVTLAHTHEAFHGECEEPECARPATKVWGGRRMCSDHYDRHRDARESLTHELDSD